MKKIMKKILGPIEAVAEVLRFKNATSMLIEVGLAIAVLYSLSVVLSFGWQANTECVTWRPLVEQAKICAETETPEGYNFTYYPQVECTQLTRFGTETFKLPNQTQDNSSLWYELENGTNFTLPKWTKLDKS